jgi:hypothetical protein
MVGFGGNIHSAKKMNRVLTPPFRQGQSPRKNTSIFTDPSDTSMALGMAGASTETLSTKVICNSCDRKHGAVVPKGMFRSMVMA